MFFPTPIHFMRRILTVILTASCSLWNGSIPPFISGGTHPDSRISNANGTGHKLPIETMVTERRAPLRCLSFDHCTAEHILPVYHMKSPTQKLVCLLVRTSLKYIHADHRGLKRLYGTHACVTFCQEDCEERYLSFRRSVSLVSVTNEAYTFFAKGIDDLLHTNTLTIKTRPTIPFKSWMKCKRSTALSTRSTSRPPSCNGSVVPLYTFVSYATTAYETECILRGAEQEPTVLEKIPGMKVTLRCLRVVKRICGGNTTHTVTHS